MEGTHISSVIYRPIADSELTAAAEVFRTANLDLQRRGGVAAPQAEDLDSLVGRYRHVYQTGIFHVAEVDGRVVGVACAVVRGHIWFLAGFWVLPEFQRGGVGGPLLLQVYEAGRSAGADVFCVWASSDPTAMASYMKLGMLPGSQILKFSGSPTGLGGVLGYAVEPLDPQVAVAVDRVVRGVAREEDHQYWAAEGGHVGRQVLRDGQPVGYYYLSGGAVGAAAWLHPEDAEPVMALLLGEAAQAGEVRLNCTGDNHAAIRLALRAGLKLYGHSHFLTTEPFGKLGQYLVSGPLLF